MTSIMYRKAQKNSFTNDNISIKNLLIYLNNLDVNVNTSSKSHEELKLLYEITHRTISSHQKFYLEQLFDYYLLNEKIINELNKLINDKSYRDNTFGDLVSSTLSEHEFGRFIRKTREVLKTT